MQRLTSWFHQHHHRHRPPRVYIWVTNPLICRRSTSRFSDTIFPVFVVMATARWARQVMAWHWTSNTSQGESSVFRLPWARRCSHLVRHELLVLVTNLLGVRYSPGELSVGKGDKGWARTFTPIKEVREWPSHRVVQTMSAWYVTFLICSTEIMGADMETKTE